MQKFIVQHAVDFSTGKAVIGKAHVVQKREEVIAAAYMEKVEKATESTVLFWVTPEKVQELRNAGMTYEQIALELECSVNVIRARMRKAATKQLLETIKQ